MATALGFTVLTLNYFINIVVVNRNKKPNQIFNNFEVSNYMFDIL